MNNSTGSFTNSSDPPDLKIDESIAPVALQAFFAVTGNSVAITFLICSSKTHQWKPFYRLVLGLAITDLAGATFHFPTALYRYASGFTFEFPKQLCDFLSFDFSFAFMSSALIVCAMSIDRHMAINYPFSYFTNSKGRRTNIVLIVIWLSTALICSLHFFGLGSSKLYYPGSWCFLNFASTDAKDRANTYIYCTVGIIVLLTTVVVNCIAIVSMCRKQQNIKRHNKQNDTFIIFLLLSIVITFGICWTPLMIRMLINASVNNPVNGPAELLAIRLAITNGIVNPWLYIFVRKENFLAILRLVSRIRACFGHVEKKTQNCCSEDLTVNVVSLSNIQK